jgi:hypothetical protein
MQHSSEGLGDEAIRALVKRLSRPGPSGVAVIERAAILASGADSREILSWIAAHDGAPEAPAPVKAAGGLHGTRMRDGADPEPRVPLRYVLPAGTLG